MNLSWPIKDMILTYRAILDFQKFRRVQVVLKEEDTGDGNGYESRVQKLLEAQMGLSGLLGKDVMLLPIGSCTIDIICKDVERKSIKKKLKAAKKTLKISINKKVEDVPERDIIRKAYENELKESLLKSGWSCPGLGLYFKSDLSVEEDGEPAFAARMKVQLEKGSTVVLIVSLDVTKLRHKKILSLLPADALSRFWKGEFVRFPEWIDLQPDDILKDFECTSFPNLEDGLIIGCGKHNMDPINEKGFRENWLQKCGVRVASDFFMVEVRVFREGETAVIKMPSPCVLTAAGAMPVPFSTRQRLIKSALDNLENHISFPLTEPSKASSPSTMMQENAWMSVRSLVLQERRSADAMLGRNLSAVPGSGFQCASFRCKPQPLRPYKEPLCPTKDLCVASEQEDPANEMPMSLAAKQEDAAYSHQLEALLQVHPVVTRREK